MNRIRTTQRAALVVVFLTVLSIGPAFADGGGSQGGSGGKPPCSCKAPATPANPVVVVIEKLRALFGL